MLGPATMPDNQWSHDIMEAPVGVLEADGSQKERPERARNPLQNHFSFLAGQRAQRTPLLFDLLRARIFLCW